ncbi:hypothetical protein TNCV_1046521 [Trichonephila clavipes]|nr:hypothetical protein TNCV_1046521 [Trichonephila clavipes]
MTSWLLLDVSNIACWRIGIVYCEEINGTNEVQELSVCKIIRSLSSCGHSSQVAKVKDSWPAFLEFEPRFPNDSPLRGGKQLHVKSVEIQAFSQ